MQHQPNPDVDLLEAAREALAGLCPTRRSAHGRLLRLAQDVREADAAYAVQPDPVAAYELEGEYARVLAALPPAPEVEVPPAEPEARS